MHSSFNFTNRVFYIRLVDTENILSPEAERNRHIKTWRKPHLSNQAGGQGRHKRNAEYDEISNNIVGVYATWEEVNITAFYQINSFRFIYFHFYLNDSNKSAISYLLYVYSCPFLYMFIADSISYSYNDDYNITYILSKTNQHMHCISTVQNKA